MDERIRLLEDLANPVRYRVLTRLERAPASASELATALGVSATVLANHLRRLRERGLVDVRHEGRHAAYELAEPGLRELFSVLNELRDVAPPTRPSGRRRAPRARATTTCPAGSAWRSTTRWPRRARSCPPAEASRSGRTPRPRWRGSGSPCRSRGAG